MKFLPAKDFEKRQNSKNQAQKLALRDSMARIIPKTIEKKTKAKELKEKGNAAFQKKNFKEAEKYYSEAIQLNIGSRPLWTNRAICRNRMEDFEDALLDCDTALKIDPKCTKSITQKGNALFGLRRFDEARECYELLHTLGESSLADSYLKKIPHAPKKNSFIGPIIVSIIISIAVSVTMNLFSVD